MYTGWAKKTALYILLFIVLVYLFTFTNNIPCELKLCPTYIEDQTKLICQQVVQKNYDRIKAPQRHYVTMAEHYSSACLCLYPINSSVQQPDSQVNCSMCPQYLWDFCWTQLTAYQFSYTLDILFRSDSPQPSATGLPRDRVRCVSLVQKISNRTDGPLPDRKLFTNTFCIPSLFLTNEFNPRFIFVKGMFVYQQTVT